MLSLMSKRRARRKPSKIQRKKKSSVATTSQLKAKIAKLQQQLKKAKPQTQREKNKGYTVLSPKQLSARLLKQREQTKQDRVKDRAKAVARKFRTRKVDYGKIVFVTTQGKRDAASKGRKGYAIHVNRKGQKRVIKQYRDGFRPARITELEFDVTKPPKGAVKKFIESQRKLIEHKRAVVKIKGSIKVSGTYDFSDKVVDSIANSLQRAFGSQMSQRRFLVNANVLVKLPDGTMKVYNVLVPISKPDHIAIELGGMHNFVRLKFYAFLAKQLAFDGYVTSGSANHVRRLKENAGKDKEEWTKGGIAWEGRHDTEQVQIKQIEWKIEQAI